LPKWHLKELWFPGLMAGLLYSLGNFSAILAVTYLGHGTGFSFCQMQLFVSGLWGVFYFKEIRGTATITKWFASAFVAVFGIVYLSYQHEGASGGHRRLHCFVDTLKETFPQWA
jgi:glucose uptake protein GlcU